jgi:hypothetical protein
MRHFHALLAARELLQERVNRLSAALERLSEGSYGVRVECAEPLATAEAFEALPEVETCIRCQAGLESLSRRSFSSRLSVFAGGDNETADETGRFRFMGQVNIGPMSNGQTVRTRLE